MTIKIMSLTSLKRLYEQSRMNGYLITVILLLCSFKFRFEVAASQKTVNFGFSEVFLLIGMGLLLYLIQTKQYLFTITTKKIFFLTIISCSIFLAISGYHVIFNNESVYEFIGVFRNIYGCMVLFFLIDAGIFKKQEISNGIVNLALIYSLSVLSVVIYNAYFFDLHEYESYRWSRFIMLEDDLTILAALTVMCVWFLSRGGVTKTQLIKTVFILATVLIGAMECGERSQTMPVLTLFILLPFFFININSLQIIKIQVISLLVAVMAFGCISLTSPNSNYLSLKLFRGNPLIIETSILFSGLKGPTTEELAKNYGMRADDLDKKTRVTELIYDGSSSAARSSVFRKSLIIEDLKILADSPFVGTGKRVRSQAYLNDHVNDFYTPPNFILHIALLAGVPSALGYIMLIGFVLSTLVFAKKGLHLNEKLILMLALMPIFLLSMFHDGLAGGALLNIVLWLIVSYFFLVYKQRVYGMAEQRHSILQAKVV